MKVLLTIVAVLACSDAQLRVRRAYGAPPAPSGAAASPGGAALRPLSVSTAGGSVGGGRPALGNRGNQGGGGNGGQNGQAYPSYGGQAGQGRPAAAASGAIGRPAAALTTPQAQYGASGTGGSRGNGGGLGNRGNGGTGGTGGYGGNGGNGGAPGAGGSGGGLGNRLGEGAPMPYEFDWEVDDAPSGNQYGHEERSDGRRVDGQYQVLLPDSRVQTVTYYVQGDSGYVVEVAYEGEAKFDEPAAGAGGNGLGQRGGNGGYQQGGAGGNGLGQRGGNGGYQQGGAGGNGLGQRGGNGGYQQGGAGNQAGGAGNRPAQVASGGGRFPGPQGAANQLSPNSYLAPGSGY